jgi:cadmium resistance protein CadD (predicted permease)
VDRTTHGDRGCRGFGPTFLTEDAIPYLGLVPLALGVRAAAQVFANVGAGSIAVYAAVFFVLLGVRIAAGRYFVARPGTAPVLSRWGHVLLPVVLVGLGVLILEKGGAFGL